jgi:hypothetical protein
MSDHLALRRVCAQKPSSLAGTFRQRTVQVHKNTVNAQLYKRSIVPRWFGAWVQLSLGWVTLSRLWPVQLKLLLIVGQYKRYSKTKLLSSVARMYDYVQGGTTLGKG